MVCQLIFVTTVIIAQGLPEEGTGTEYSYLAFLIPEA